MSTALCSNKVTLVTGAASGIGRAVALTLSREGASVMLADRNHEGVEELARHIQKTGNTAAACSVEVSNDRSVTEMVEATVRRFGRLDCAVNNAGIGGTESRTAGLKTAEIPNDSWDKLIAINLTGVWLCMKREINTMLGSGGAIVNMASVAGLVGLPMGAAYTASKHAVVGLTRAAAAEYATSNIRINAVCPGYIETPLLAANIEQRRSGLEAVTPMGRLGTPEEIAELVVWLCSDRASYVTGAAYAADGGYTSR
jgi:NAD(P)-dependent dehydrogenase (short-subunit alcohol dehydrogenase family)